MDEPCREGGDVVNELCHAHALYLRPTNPTDIERIAPSARLRINAKELQMMRLWRTLTSTTMASSNLRFAFLRDVLPALANSHHCILDTIFAVTSFHQAYLTPELSKAHVALGILYRDRALTGLRNRMHSLTAECLTAVNQCFAILGITLFAHHNSGERGPCSQSPISVLEQLAQLWHTDPWITGLSESLMVIRKTPVNHQHELYSSCWRRPHSQDLFLLHKASLLIESRNIDDQEILYHLGMLFRNENHKVLHVLVSIICLPRHHISREFGARTPLSSVFLGLYARLLQKHNSFWWMQNFGSHLLEEVFSVSEEDGFAPTASI
jgi:hypothetical protein